MKEKKQENSKFLKKKRKYIEEEEIYRDSIF